MVHISTTACATAKPFTPMCSPWYRNYQKNSGLSIWTTSWPYFFEVLSTWIASNKRNLKSKWCTSQQLLVLRQNRLHQCVRLVVGIIRKIVACRFEQLRDLIILLTDCRFLFKNNGVLFENDVLQIGIKSMYQKSLGKEYTLTHSLTQSHTHTRLPPYTA